MTLTPTGTPKPCLGDCNGDSQVAVNELIQMVNIALGIANVTGCTAGDANGDGTITINEIIAAVNNALNGCPTEHVANEPHPGILEPESFALNQTNAHPG